MFSGHYAHSIFAATDVFRRSTHEPEKKLSRHQQAIHDIDADLFSEGADLQGIIEIPLDLPPSIYINEFLGVIHERIFISQIRGENYLHGMIDIEGNMIIAPEYESLDFVFISTSNCVHAVKNNKHGYLNLNGEIQIPFVYDYLSKSVDNQTNLIGAGIGNKNGLVNMQGQVVVPFVYDQIFTMRFGLAVVQQGDLWGMINKDGSIIVPLQYLEAQPPQHGIAFFRDNDGWYLFDYEEKQLIAINGKPLRVLSRDRILISNLDDSDSIYYGLIDHRGEIIIPISYGSYVILDKFEGTGFSLTLLDSEAAFRDGRDLPYSSGTSELALTLTGYSSSRSLTGDRIAVEKNGLWGYLDATGEEIIEPQFGAVCSFSEGRAIVYREGVFYLLDLMGKEVARLDYDYPSIYSESLEINRFSSGFSLVSRDDLFGYIDYNGNLSTPLSYEYAGRFRDSFAVAMRNGQWIILYAIDNRVGGVSRPRPPTPPDVPFGITAVQ